tara:strand:+ start:1255 stop:1419 length:165 start_codon:yes stop_codon:yes gene_type:complete
MTGNLQEFIGMASFVTSATIFVVGLRYAILKMGEGLTGEDARSDPTSQAGVAQR